MDEIFYFCDLNMSARSAFVRCALCVGSLGRFSITSKALCVFLQKQNNTKHREKEEEKNFFFPSLRRYFLLLLLAVFQFRIDSFRKVLYNRYEKAYNIFSVRDNFSTQRFVVSFQIIYFT